MKIKERFCNLLGEENVLTDELMSSHTTFRIGGAADYFLLPTEGMQIKGIFEICREEGIPCFILGNGSNLLVSDKGYRGAVIQMYRNMNKIETEGTVIRAQAGALLSAVAAEAKNHSLTGFEFAGGIPGTLGGAVTMNAGAYGGEMKDVLVSVTYLTREGEIVTEDAANLDLSYRHSIFEENGGCILSAKFHLKRGDSAAIKARMDELMQKRVDKQPLDKPSAGSTFKRPVGAFAAALIDQCGLRGYRHGGAAVSEKHCGFVVNLGGATCADVLALCDEVRAVVKEKTGYDLEKEIRVVKA